MDAHILLATERLLLREFVEADAPAFFRMVSDPAVTRFTGDGGITNVEQALDVLRAYPLADYQKYGYGRWACVLRESGEVIGFAGLKFLDDLREVDIGYRFLQSYWGRGLATEAGRAVLAYGFERLKLGQIIGLVDPENVASVRVLVKLGLAYAGLIEFRGDIVGRYVAQAPARVS